MKNKNPKFFSFHSEFEALLSQRLGEHLGRMYELCARVATALDKLKQVLEAYIVREGRAAIQQITQSAMNVSGFEK